MKGKIILLTGALYLAIFSFVFVPSASAQSTATPRSSVGTEYDDTLLISSQDLGFRVPSFEQFMSFLIKFFFVLAGLLALFYMLWGAISWVTSGGDKDAVGKARDKIMAAVVGVVLIIATLAIIAALEQIVFKKRVCFGLTCELKLPSLLRCPDSSEPVDGVCPGDTDSGTGSGGTLASGSSASPVEAGQPGNGTAAGNAGEQTAVLGTEAGTNVEGSEGSVEAVLPATGL